MNDCMIDEVKHDRLQLIRGRDAGGRDAGLTGLLNVLLSGHYMSLYLLKQQ